jgi:hypothetical protein
LTCELYDQVIADRLGHPWQFVAQATWKITIRVLPVFDTSGCPNQLDEIQEKPSILPKVQFKERVREMLGYDAVSWSTDDTAEVLRLSIYWIL